MKRRCTNPRDVSFEWYGGKGISFDPRWNTFINFFEDMGECPDGMSIDRKDVNKNYSKSNCHWATQLSQQRNRGNNARYTYNGETKCVREWEDLFGFKRATLWARLKLGWDIKKAIETPIGTINSGRYESKKI